MSAMSGSCTRRTRLARAATALAACAAFLSACAEEPAPEPEVARPVQVVVFGSEAAEEVLEFPGTIRAAERAETSFEVSGRVIEFPVNEGDQVEAGQLLARLDPQDYKAEADRKEAVLAAAKAEFARQEKLFAEGVAPEAEYDLARRNYDVAVAGARIANKALADTELRAPFAGRVARKLVDNFQNVQAKEAVISFQSDSGVEIQVAIPERDAARMPKDLSLAERSLRTKPEVLVSAFPDQTFPARLTEFATRADPTTRTFAATLAFETPEEVNVLPGMTASVRVYVKDESQVAGATLPASAVFADADGDSSVWIVDPESLRVGARKVQSGELSGTSLRILAGVEDGEWVATTGVHQLRDGMLVRRPEL